MNVCIGAFSTGQYFYTLPIIDKYRAQIISIFFIYYKTDTHRHDGYLLRNFYSAEQMVWIQQRIRSNCVTGQCMQ